MIYPIQYISQGSTLELQRSNIDLAIKAGLPWIQIRVKRVVDQECFKSFLKDFTEQVAGAQLQLILNDYVHLADELEFDGVHLGQDDMPIHQARRIIGDQKIIGATANTFEQICRAVDQGADYIGLGPFRNTQTKEKLAPILGPEGMDKIMNAIDKAQIKVPIIGVGGLDINDWDYLKSKGLYGIAFSSALHRQTHAEGWVKQFKDKMQCV